MSNANHHSGKGAIIAADLDIALLNAGKKKEDNFIRPQKHREPNKFFYQNMIKLIAAQKKHFHINEIYKIIHKIDIAE